MFMMNVLLVATLLGLACHSSSSPQLSDRPIFPPRETPFGGSLNRQTSNARPSNPSVNGGLSSSAPIRNTRSDDSIVSNSVLELALDMSFEQWSKGNAGNMIHSPLSIGSLLSMLMLGSRGTSYEEMRIALGYSPARPDESIHQAYQGVIEGLNQVTPGVNVQMSNALFLQRGLPVLGEYTRLIQENYKTQLNSVDFEGRPRDTMRLVNAHVNKATDGKIPKIVQEPFSRDTSFVAVNSIYFNGLWEHPFDKQATYEGNFNTGSKSIKIPMMVNEVEVPYLGGGSSGIDMVALPYKGGKFSMYIMQPRGNNGLTSLISLEHGLDTILINGLIKSMTTEKVAVTIPRMSMRQKFSLKTDLQRLGIKEIFGARANFGRMTSQSGVFIDDIIHEAVLEMTETGTVAAAATLGSTDRILVKRFALDKPSLLFIRDDTNGVILFWARLVEPVPLRA